MDSEPVSGCQDNDRFPDGPAVQPRYSGEVRSSRPRVPHPITTGCGRALFGSVADAGELETDPHAERAHGEAAGRETVKPFGQAGFSFAIRSKEDEPWLCHIAVPGRQGGRIENRWAF